MSDCSFCLKKTFLVEDYICSPCLDFFLDSSPKKKLGIYSLFKYEKDLRRVIVKTKVKNNPQCLRSLLSLLRNSFLANELAIKSDKIMAAPSSLWSRARGRVDLAWLLANTLSKEHKKELIYPPFKLLWRLKKRAQKKRLGESYNCSYFTKQKSNKTSVLVIDDIVTTGFTLNKLCHELEPMYNGEILTLAYSR